MINITRRWLDVAGLLAFGLVTACSAANARRTDELQGIVEHDERILGFEVGGRVQSLAVDRGAAVTSGLLLATLDDGMERPLRDARLAEKAAAEAQLRLLEAGPRSEEIRAARAELQTLESQRALAQRSLDRQVILEASGASAIARRDEIDSSIATIDGRREATRQQLLALRRGARSEEITAAEARVSATTAAILAIDARLERFTLEAPAAGVVIDRHVSVGEVLAPGTPAFTVADLDHPFVDVFVPEGRMRAIRLGTAATAHVDGVAESLHGRVEFISSHTEFTPRFLFSDRERPNLVLRVRVRLDDPQHRLHAGVPAFVTIAGLR